MTKFKNGIPHKKSKVQRRKVLNYGKDLKIAQQEKKLSVRDRLRNKLEKKKEEFIREHGVWEWLIK